MGMRQRTFQFQLGRGGGGAGGRGLPRLLVLVLGAVVVAGVVALVLFLGAIVAVAGLALSAGAAIYFGVRRMLGKGPGTRVQPLEQQVKSRPVSESSGDVRVIDVEVLRETKRE